jgi:hypothetical protein
LWGDEDWLGATVKLFHLYLEDGPAPSLDLLDMCISPWYQFRIKARSRQ